MPKALGPGLAFSYVNRVDGQVHLHLHLPHFSDGETAGARVQLTNGVRTKVSPATITLGPSGAILEATLATGALRKGAWQIHISPRPGAKFVGTGSRVLLSDPNPISLLMGAAPASVVPKNSHPLDKRQQLIRSAVRVTDRVLAELPPERADRTRRTLRAVAHKVIPNRIMPS